MLVNIEQVPVRMPAVIQAQLSVSHEILLPPARSTQPTTVTRSYWRAILTIYNLALVAGSRCCNPAHHIVEFSEVGIMGCPRLEQQAAEPDVSCTVGWG